jgi:hypothetical protein
LLTGCLPGHAKLRGDLRPPDVLADGSVDEHRQFCLGIVSLDPDEPDLLQQLGRGQLGDSLRRARLARGCRIAPVRPRLPSSLAGLCLDLLTSPAWTPAALATEFARLRAETTTPSGTAPPPDRPT